MASSELYTIPLLLFAVAVAAAAVYTPAFPNAPTGQAGEILFSAGNLAENASLETDTGADYFPSWSEDDSTPSNSIPDGWVFQQLSAEGLTDYELDSTEAFADSKSFKMSFTEPTSSQLSQDVQIDAGTYKVVGMVKTNLTEGFATIATECHYGDNHAVVPGECDFSIAPEDSPQKLSGQADWQKVVLKAGFAPEGSADKFIRVKCAAVDAVGEIWCDGFKVEQFSTTTTYPAPAIPSGFKAESVSATAAKLTWNPNSEEDFWHYNLTINEDNFKIYSGTEYVTENLEIGKSYVAYLRAVNEYGGESAAANTSFTSSKNLGLYVGDSDGGISASSSQEEFPPKGAFDGVHSTETAENSWVASGETVGAWVQRDFPRFFEVDKIYIHPRNNFHITDCERPKSVKLYFLDGTETISLTKNLEFQEFVYGRELSKLHNTDFIKFEVLSTQTTSCLPPTSSEGAGFSEIRVFGFPGTNLDLAPPTNIKSSANDGLVKVTWAAAANAEWYEISYGRSEQYMSGWLNTGSDTGYSFNYAYEVLVKLRSCNSLGCSGESALKTIPPKNYDSEKTVCDSLLGNSCAGETCFSEHIGTYYTPSDYSIPFGDYESDKTLYSPFCCGDDSNEFFTDEFETGCCSSPSRVFFEADRYSSGSTYPQKVFSCVSVFPQNFSAEATENSKVFLSWDSLEPAPSHYRLSRVSPEPSPSNPYTAPQKWSLTENSFTDSLVSAGETYVYSVASVDKIYSSYFVGPESEEIKLTLGASLSCGDGTVQMDLGEQCEPPDGEPNESRCPGEFESKYKCDTQNNRIGLPLEAGVCNENCVCSYPERVWDTNTSQGSLYCTKCFNTCGDSQCNCGETMDSCVTDCGIMSFDERLTGLEAFPGDGEVSLEWNPVSVPDFSYGGKQYSFDRYEVFYIDSDNYGISMLFKEPDEPVDAKHIESLKTYGVLVESPDPRKTVSGCPSSFLDCEPEWGEEDCAEVDRGICIENGTEYIFSVRGVYTAPAESGGTIDAGNSELPFYTHFSDPGYAMPEYIYVPPSHETDCDDGIDNDEDGLVDADDPDCWGTEVCDDGIDNDGDGLVDFEDPDCRLPVVIEVNPPENLTAEFNAGTVELEWNEADPSPDRYRVYRREEGEDFERIWSTALTSYDDDSFEFDSTYFYAVTSYIKGEESGYSNTVSVDIPGEEEPPPDSNDSDGPSPVPLDLTELYIGLAIVAASVGLTLAYMRLV